MAKIIAVANQKGGVGKTTTAINLCAALGETQRRVLLIDLDPQGNATTGAGVDKNAHELTTCDVLLNACQTQEAIVSPEHVKFDVMPSNADLTAAEVQLITTDGRERRLAEALSQVEANYDYIYIDCPPALNVLTLNAFVAANGVLIPMQCEYYALEGLSSLLQTIKQVQGSVNPRLAIEGILRTMFDGRNKLGHEVSNQLIEHFESRVYRTIIPRNIRLAEAPSFGQPIVYYDKSSRGSIAYLALAGEIIRREMANESARTAARSQAAVQTKVQDNSSSSIAADQAAEQAPDATTVQSKSVEVPATTANSAENGAKAGRGDKPVETVTQEAPPVG